MPAKNKTSEIDLQSTKAEIAEQRAEIDRLSKETKVLIENFDRVNSYMSNSAKGVESKKQQPKETRSDEKSFFDGVINVVKSLVKNFSNWISNKIGAVENDTTKASHSKSQDTPIKHSTTQVRESLNAVTSALNATVAPKLALKESMLKQTDHKIRDPKLKKKLTDIQSYEKKAVNTIEKIKTIAAEDKVNPQRALPMRDLIRERAWLDATEIAAIDNQKSMAATLEGFTKLYHKEQEAFSLPKNPTEEKLETLFNKYCDRVLEVTLKTSAPTKDPIEPEKETKNDTRRFGM